MPLDPLLTHGGVWGVGLFLPSSACISCELYAKGTYHIFSIHSFFDVRLDRVVASQAVILVFEIHVRMKITKRVG